MRFQVTEFDVLSDLNNQPRCHAKFVMLDDEGNPTIQRFGITNLNWIPDVFATYVWTREELMEAGVMDKPHTPLPERKLSIPQP